MTKPGDKPNGTPGGRSIRFVGGTAPPPLAPSRTGRRKPVPASPIIITTADGKTRTASPAEFERRRKSKSLTKEQRKVVDAKARLKKLLALARTGQVVSAKWERRVRAAAREAGKNDDQIRAILERAAARGPVDPRRR